MKVGKGLEGKICEELLRSLGLFQLREDYWETSRL